MERHAALPHREDLERMRGVVARLVEQHVAEPAADHDAEHAEEQQVLDVAPGPAGVGELRQARRARAASHRNSAEGDQVGEAVPVDRDRQADLRQVERDRVELRVHEHAAMIRAASRRRRAMTGAGVIRSSATPIDRRDSPCRSTAAPATSPRAWRARRTARCTTRMGYEEGDFDKPMIGVANGHSTITPCNSGLQKLADAAVAGIEEAGGNAQIFGTPTISDGMAMGTEGMKYSLVSREVIADCIETCVGGQWMDGVLVDRRLRQEHARRHDGHAARQRAGDLRLRRHHPARPLQGPGPEHRQRVRGGRPVHRRQA